MFGRGKREDLYEEDAEKLAAELRQVIKEEVDTSLRVKSSI
jgi:hypothetical protein